MKTELEQKLTVENENRN